MKVVLQRTRLKKTRLLVGHTAHLQDPCVRSPDPSLTSLPPPQPPSSPPPHRTMPPSPAYQQQPITDADVDAVVRGVQRAAIFPPRLADPAHPDE